MGVLKWIGGWLAATIVLAVLATALQSAFVIGMLEEIGAEISAGPAVSMIAYDLAGLGPLYGAILGIGLLVAFLAGSALNRFTGLRTIVFAGAGAVCVAVALFLMEQVFFGVQMIAGARTVTGFLAQVIAGGAAGLLFAALTPPPRRAG
ncbi:MAG: hypothetical protein ABL308_01260 [Oceanicaulis sp.]